MDLERMKKINQMIPELKKQGFAATSNEAAMQSDQLYRNLQNDDIITRTANLPTPDQNSTAPAVETPDTGVAGSVVGGAAPEVMATVSALEGRVEALEGQLDQVISKMNEMIQVITHLEEGGKASADAPKEEVQQKISKKQSSEEKKEPHARSGNYTSSDVDINKIFYYGNK